MSKLSRKKVRVRSKSGKTFMRSIMMKSDNGGDEIGAWGFDCLGHALSCTAYKRTVP